WRRMKSTFPLPFLSQLSWVLKYSTIALPIFSPDCSETEDTYKRSGFASKASSEGLVVLAKIGIMPFSVQVAALVSAAVLLGLLAPRRFGVVVTKLVRLLSCVGMSFWLSACVMESVPPAAATLFRDCRAAAIKVSAKLYQVTRGVAEASPVEA